MSVEKYLSEVIAKSLATELVDPEKVISSILKLSVAGLLAL